VIVEKPSERALILGYHRVATLDSDPWSLCVSPHNFAAQMDYLCRRGRPQGLSNLMRARLNGEQFPGSSIAVTFDDGYVDTLTGAAPILEHYRVPATIFLPTGQVGSRLELWWDALERMLLTSGRLPSTLETRIAGVPWIWRLGEAAVWAPDDVRRHASWRAWEPPPTERHAAYCDLWKRLGPLDEGARQAVLNDLFEAVGLDPQARHTHRLLRLDELQTLGQKDLVEFGAHSVTHAMLASLPATDQRKEIKRSKEWLDELTGRPTSGFAYPYGQKTHYTAETMALVREAGYVYACANFRGTYDENTNRFEIPRIQVEDWNADQFEHELVSCLSRD
jgi:peptidoglycan/xylan/chitin deacetylase (PgdA/CDA1 family)